MDAAEACSFDNIFDLEFEYVPTLDDKYAHLPTLSLDENMPMRTLSLVDLEKLINRNRRRKE